MVYSGLSIGVYLWIVNAASELTDDHYSSRMRSKMVCRPLGFKVLGLDRQHVIRKKVLWAEQRLIFLSILVSSEHLSGSLECLMFWFHSLSLSSGRFCPRRIRSACDFPAQLEDKLVLPFISWGQTEAGYRIKTHHQPNAGTFCAVGRNFAYLPPLVAVDM